MGLIGFASVVVVLLILLLCVSFVRSPAVQLPTRPLVATHNGRTLRVTLTGSVFSAAKRAGPTAVAAAAAPAVKPSPPPGPDAGASKAPRSKKISLPANTPNTVTAPGTAIPLLLMRAAQSLPYPAP